jgi:hypothetical protein
MASTRTFYRTVIELEVLSTEPPTFDDFLQVYKPLADKPNNCVGLMKDTIYQKIDGPTMATLLQGQGKHPHIFGLDKQGNDEALRE